MENTLHHQLKNFFRLPGAPIEVRLARYRIDVVNGDRLVEIQRSGLAAIRSKIENLLAQGFKVDVVKPIVARKLLVKLNQEGGEECERRWSPLNGGLLDIFDELIYFTRTFPHPRLRLLVPLVTIEEMRYPGHGRRRRRRTGDFVVQDRQILELHATHELATVQDLFGVLPPGLAEVFDTSELAAHLSIPRYQAQRIAYVLKKTGTTLETGKRGNAICYRPASIRESQSVLKTKTRGLPGATQVKTILKQALAAHALALKSQRL